MTGTKKNVQISEENGIVPLLVVSAYLHNLVTHAFISDEHVLAIAGRGIELFESCC